MSLNKYRLKYWPGSGSLKSDWYKDPEVLAKLEKTVEFEATEAWAKERASMTFNSVNSDGVQLQRYTMNTEGGWYWENVY